MSFLKCCVGGDPRPPPEAIRPVGGSANPNRRAAAARPPAGAGSSLRPDALAASKKIKAPNEVFFDPSKPDGQLSSVTDPPNSGREFSDAKKRKEGKDRAGHLRDGGKTSTADERADMDAPDNNGLTRGQNFMKVEKWLRNACMYKQIDVTPGVIANIEDVPTDLPDNSADPPSEKDRLPPSMANQQHSSSSRAR